MVTMSESAEYVADNKWHYRNGKYWCNRCGSRAFLQPDRTIYCLHCGEIGLGRHGVQPDDSTGNVSGHP